jgi:hypothetical protein
LIEVNDAKGHCNVKAIGIQFEGLHEC